MTPTDQVFVWLWNGRRLIPGSADTVLAVADSWLIEDGMARGVSLHHDRFVRACERECGLAPESVRRFLAQVTATLPPHGRWFPRVECGLAKNEPRLRLTLRPAPAVAESAVLVPHYGPDPRRRPRTKGPDLPELLALRRSAAEVQADETLLLTDDRIVLEGALSAVVWWRADTLCVPDAGLPVLDSVTRRLVVRLAKALSIPVRQERCPLSDLDGLEVWVLSSLQGIRAVTGWQNCAVTPGPCTRAAQWRAYLTALAKPFPPPRDGTPVRPSLLSDHG